MKIYIPKVRENWIIDRIRKEWYESTNNISTKFITSADIIWINAPWAWEKLNKKKLNSKLVVSTIHHIEENNSLFDFKNFDKYIDFYHTPSLKTLEQLRKLTNKKIFHIPYWINNKNYFYIEDKQRLRKKYGFKSNDYLIGSFQRDTEGYDLKSPKLIKGPDIFINKVINLFANNKEIVVVLTGKRRQYIIDELKSNNIPFKYFEMVQPNEINELYNILNLYIVSSRIEGGPQAILECAITKTPIISTDVGLASEILHESSIYKNEISNAEPNVQHAYKNVEKLEISNLIDSYKSMFDEIYISRK